MPYKATSRHANCIPQPIMYVVMYYRILPTLPEYCTAEYQEGVD